MARASIIAFLALLVAACSADPEPSDTSSAMSVDLWLERLEVSSRELYSARFDVLEAAQLKPGHVVADIGAGTGLYTLLFAEAVGSDGHVYAVDIEPLFLDLINSRSSDAGLTNVSAVLNRAYDVTLPKNSVDVAFIADTYHYFADREAIMKSVYAALKPGGALIIVDYDLSPSESIPDDKAHIRFGRAGVVSEVEFIGFDLVDTPDVAGLSDNYLVRFEKR